MASDKKELFEESLDLAMKGVVYFIVVIALFLAAYIIVGALFAIIGGIAFVVLHGGYAAAAVPLAAIGAAISTFILGLYVATLYEVVGYMRSGNNVDYVNSIKGGYVRMMSKRNVTFIVVGLGFVGGLLSGLYGAFAGGIAFGFFGGGLVTLFLEGLFFAAASGIAISGYSAAKEGSDFLNMYNRINMKSANSGTFLYLTTLLPILPFVGFIQAILLPLAVSITSTDSSASQHDKQAEHRGK